MKILIGLLLMSAFVSLKAMADSAPVYFHMAQRYGDLQSSSGDQSCISAMQSFVEKAKEVPPKAIQYMVYRQVIRSGFGSCNPYDGSFQIEYRDENYQQFHFDQILTGVLYQTAGQVELKAVDRNNQNSCDLTYRAEFDFSN